MASSHNSWLDISHFYKNHCALWFVGKEQNGVEGAEIVVEDHSTQAVASDMLAGGKSAGMSV